MENRPGKRALAPAIAKNEESKEKERNTAMNINDTMNKRNFSCDQIDTFDSDPVIGERCHIRVWRGCQWAELVTSKVVDWCEGYPNALGEIRIVTENTVYSGIHGHVFANAYA